MNRSNLNSLFLFLTWLGCSCFLLSPEAAHATSATINVSGNEGNITVSASGAFSAHQFCSGSGDDQTCNTDSSGYLRISRNGVRIKTVSGDGSVSWSEIYNAGLMKQGDYVFEAVACDSKNICKSSETTITIDNKPELTGTLSGSEGAISITGTVDFKDNPDGDEGRVKIALAKEGYGYSAKGSKVYEGTEPNSWSYKSIVGNDLNAGTLSQKTYYVRVTAIAANEATRELILPFTVNNTPEVSINDITDKEGHIKVSGMVDFKENLTGNAGRIALALRKDGYGFSKKGGKDIPTGAPISWSYAEITGTKINAGTMAQGNYTVRATAEAANEVTVEAYIPFVVDNTPEISANDAINSEGKIEVTGTVDFKENLAGDAGTLHIAYRKDGYGFQKKGTTIIPGSESTDWSYSDIADTNFNAGTADQGDYTIRATAESANETSAVVYIPFTIDNTPEIEILGSKCYPDETFDIIGKTVFQPNNTGDEGSITLYLKESHQYDYQYKRQEDPLLYEGTEINWKFSDFAGKRLEKSVWGNKEIMLKAVATATNGAEAIDVKGAIIPALGCPTGF